MAFLPPQARPAIPLGLLRPPMQGGPPIMRGGAPNTAPPAPAVMPAKPSPIPARPLINAKAPPLAGKKGKAGKAKMPMQFAAKASIR